MKLLLENWREYLLTEQTELWSYDIQPDQKVIISSERWDPERVWETKQTKPSHPLEKPKGLWYGCGGVWIEWLRKNPEMANMLKRANYLYEIKLGEEVIQISNDDEFGDFQSYHAFSLEWAPDIIETAVDWKGLQEEEYNGIEICPYNPGRRSHYDSRWYYGWDVASGCIWNSAGISEVRLLAERGEQL